MKMRDKGFAIIMLLLGWFSGWYWSGSAVDGLILGVGLFNMLVLMGMTPETY